MTTVNDIDFGSLTKKFMPNDRTNEGIINTIAQTLLLNPQVALSFILRAKNSLTQLVAKEVGFVNGMLQSLNYVNSLDFPIEDDRDLIAAQSALIELDRIGNIDNQSFANYENSINNFLNTALKRIKSGSKNKFAVSATEAKEDLFIGMSGFSLYHPQIIDLIYSIVHSIENFRKTDLSKRVSRNIISSVRTSVSDVRNSLNENSKIGTAIELLSGKAMINSIIGEIDILDPVIKSGVFPFNTNIKGKTEPIPATTISNSIPPPITNENLFKIYVDEGPLQSIEYPASGVNSNVFVVSSLSSSVFDIPVGYKLYLKIGVEAPLNPPQDIPTSDPSTIWIALTPGIRTFAEVASDIENGLSTLDTLAVPTVYGHCTEFAVGGSNCLLIYGVNHVTSIQVINNIRGLIIPPYSAPYPSAHEILGFSLSQISDPEGIINLNTITRFCNLAISGISAQQKDDRLIIRSNNITPSSSLRFSTGLATTLGFSTDITKSKPNFISLFNETIEVSASALDIHPGYRILQGGNSYTVLSISGSELTVTPQLLPFSLSDILVYTDIENIINPLIKDLSSQDIFSTDVKNMKSILNPLISSTPTNAQIGDARRFLNELIVKLNNLLSILNSYTLQSSLSSNETIAKEILYTLETRNLNNARSLLLSCKFTEFFNQDINEASTGLNVMTSIENSGKEMTGSQ